MTMPTEIQNYLNKMETLMNECQKHLEAFELDKAKEKNKEISDVLAEVIEWNNNYEYKIPGLEKMQKETFSFFDTIIKLLENNASVDEAKATLKEAGIV